MRIKDAACDKFRRANGPAVPAWTQRNRRAYPYFSDAERFTIYLDTSGEPLFKRGSRQIAGEAPLRENLAAGILKLAGWKPGTPLLDPMCGSGTLLIEAAQIARGIPPGHKRGFAFEKLSSYDAEKWARIRTIGNAYRNDSGADLGSVCSDAIKLEREKTAFRTRRLASQ